MTSKIFLTLSVAGTLLTSSCAHSHAPADLRASVSSIHRYAESFKGLSFDEARNRLAGGKLSEEEWHEDKFGGKQIVAGFPLYEIRVLFLEDKVITTSIQILSK